MKKGFTLIEILLTLGIIAVIAVVTTLNLAGNRNKTLLTDTARQIGALLREAQSDSMAQSKGASWGVHIDNVSSSVPYYSLFYESSTSGSGGPSYVDVTVGQYALPAGICYATSSVPAGSSLDIVFGQISGIPSASATIALQLMSAGGCVLFTGGSSTITRAASGKIFMDDFNRANL